MRTALAYVALVLPVAHTFHYHHLHHPHGRVLSQTLVRRHDGPSMLRDTYDLVVIGGGPVGVTAALRASALGHSAILIDATPSRQPQFTGPTGLYSKALRDSALKLDVGVLRLRRRGSDRLWEMRSHHHTWRSVIDRRCSLAEQGSRMGVCSAGSGRVCSVQSFEHLHEGKCDASPRVQKCRVFRHKPLLKETVLSTRAEVGALDFTLARRFETLEIKN